MAIAFVSIVTPPFDAQYAARSFIATSPSTDPIFTIAPPPHFRNSGSTARDVKNGPFTLTAITRSHSSSLIPSTVDTCSAPALFTSIFSRPNRSTVPVTARSTSLTRRTPVPRRTSIGITCYPTYVGSAVDPHEPGRAPPARGHDIQFISYAPPIRMNPNDPRIHFREVEVESYPLFDHPPYTLALATTMLEVFESESLDLLHVHYAMPHSVSALLARSMTAPRRLAFVTTLYGTYI